MSDIITIMVIIFLLVIGLCFGSFVNALVWRLHMQSAQRRNKAKKSKNIKYRQTYSIVNGRSMCIHCRHELAWFDLIPVFSWLSLLGRCRYCNKKIDWQYPAVELITALLFVVSYLFWPYDSLGTLLASIKFASWLAVLVVLVALAVYDLRWMLLPDRLVAPISVIAAVTTLFNIFMSTETGVVGGLTNLILSLAITAGVFYIIFQLSRGRWIGGGDVKLGIFMGLLLHDPFKSFLAIFLASLIGTILVMPGLMMGTINKDTKMPFGPFLILSTFIAYIFGASIIDWYASAVLMMY